MTAIKKLMLALTMLGATAGVQASDGAFAAFGSEKTKKSSNLIHRVSFEDAGTQAAPWGQALALPAQPDYRSGYAHLTGHYNGIKLRPKSCRAAMISPVG